MDTMLGVTEVVGDTRDGLIRSVIQRYHPGLTYITDAPCDEGEYFGEWSEDGGLLVFTTECNTLNDEEMAYVVLHEIAHALAHDGRHQERFYGVLTALVNSEGIPWPTAIRMEQVIPRLWEPHLSSLTKPPLVG